LLALLFYAGTVLHAQTTLVSWNFPNNPDNATADGGIAANSTQTIITVGANSPTFATSGATTNSASANGWDAGANNSYWEITFSTSGYSNITLSSKQRSSPTGPKDFKIQYKVGSGTYADVSGGTVTNADNWTSGVTSALSLPAAVNNSSSVSIRWIMTSNTPVSSGTSVASGGTSRIDDIVVSAATAIPLPIKLISFTANADASGAMLRWTATCEQETARYIIERAEGATSFSPIAVLSAKNGGCLEDAVYTYHDAAINTGTAYRLRMEGRDGSVSYSAIRYVRRNADEGALNMSPNPATDVLHVSGLSIGSAWHITDAYGRVVERGFAEAKAFDVSVRQLAPGLYFFQSACRQTVRILKL
jgi:hypothetical protein